MLNTGIKRLLLGLILIALGCDPQIDQQRFNWAEKISNPDNYSDAALENYPAQILFLTETNSKLNSEKFQTQLDSVSNSQLTSGNTLQYFLNSDGSNEKINLIKTAQESIHVFYFSVPCDETGYQFVQALTQAAQRGVDVWLIVSGDVEAWSQSFDVGGYVKGVTNCYTALEASGAKIEFASWKLHDKALILDGTQAIIGGQNIGNNWAYSNGDNSYFRDTDILVQGPVVTQIERRFISMLKQLEIAPDVINNISSVVSKKEIQYKNQIGNESGRYGRWLENSQGGLCRFVYQSPSQNRFYLLDSYKLLVDNLSSQLVMTVPQIDMGGLGTLRYPLRKSILDFGASGGRIDLLTNGPGYISSKIIDKYYLPITAFSESWLTYAKTSLAYTFAEQTYDEILNSPINTYAYRRWIHSKIWIFDNLVVSNSSFNFDYSAESWSECALLCIDAELIRKTQVMFQKDIALSRNISELLPKQSTHNRS